MRAPDFWTGDGARARCLAPLGAAYDLAGRLRRAWAGTATAGVPLVCVGNLVAGGAGKTPVALAIAERLRGRGLEVHFLSRGHGGQAAGPLRVDPATHDHRAVGDEALLLAARAPTWIAKRRAAGARAAAAAGARVLVMDDGFQNPDLAKDLALVVVDGGYGFGNGRVLPAGPLREKPARGLARAHGVVLIGEDRHGIAARLAPPLPVLRAALVPEPAAAARLAGRRVLAFAGIGRPAKLFETLAELGAEVVERKGFADHHRYSAAEVEALLARAAALEALAVTTEKDHVRLPPALAARVETLPVALHWRDPTALDALLARLGPHG